MTTTLPGLPDGLTGADLSRGAVFVDVDEALYPLEAIYGAAYIFLDRAYVLLDRPRPGIVRVTVSPKSLDGIDEAALRRILGELGNELLSCAWRHQITQQNRALIEQVTAQAVGGAMGPPSLDELAKFDFSSEAFEDPLGIATSWEEKYKKKPSGGSSGPAGSGEQP